MERRSKRIHKSSISIVNYLTKISSFEKNRINATITNQAQIPISRNLYADLKELLGI